MSLKTRRYESREELLEDLRVIQYNLHISKEEEEIICDIFKFNELKYPEVSEIIDKVVIDVGRGVYHKIGTSHDTILLNDLKNVIDRLYKKYTFSVVFDKDIDPNKAVERVLNELRNNYIEVLSE